MKKISLILLITVAGLLLSSCFLVDIISVVFENKQNNVINMKYVDYIGENNKPSYDIAFFDLEGVPYIEIEDYFDAMQSIIDTDLIQFQKTSQSLTIQYTFSFSSHIEKDLYFEYDYSSGQAKVNHFEFFKLYEKEISLHEEIYHSEFIDIDLIPSPEIFFPLKSYELELIIVNQKHYIQLDLANLMFAPEFSALYYSGDQISALFSDDEMIYNLGSKYFFMEMPNDIRLFTTYYLAFYFDYFYGNHFELSSTTYLNFFESRRNEFLQRKTNDYYKVLDFMFEDFSDGHLTLIYEGYYGDGHPFDYSDYEYKGRMEQHYRTIEEMESYCTESSSRRLTNDIALLFVSDFSTYALEVFAVDVLKYVKDEVVDVIIDLSCNPGGYLVELMDMLGFLTDDIMTIYKANLKYGSMMTSTYTSLLPKIDKNLYIKTSPISYSSANILTLYAKQNNLATIVGTPTTGGSSHVIYLFGPAGMIFVAPSMYHFSNANKVNYEFGITPDYVIENSNLEQLIQLVQSLR
jgi:hypothetical protein